jgi:8-amino-3,8-dideoxy-alpha-D-manno-octulosonate transaminase
MPDNVYTTIIDGLHKINFHGRLSTHFYGEPLLDKRLPELLNYARRRLPFSYIQINTNGDFLNEALFISLYRNGLDKLIVTNYDDFPKDHLLALQAKYPVHVFLRSSNDFGKVNRAGKIFRSDSLVDKPCKRPIGQLVINWEGNVLLCCQDFYAENVIGNIMRSTLPSIWNCDTFNTLRQVLLSGQRSQIPLCKNCDYSGQIPR